MNLVFNRLLLTHEIYHGMCYTVHVLRHTCSHYTKQSKDQVKSTETFNIDGAIFESLYIQYHARLLFSIVLLV